MSALKTAMLVRQFSPHGGLELYAHKVVEGLLNSGVQVTVICQENTSRFEHANLKFKMMPAEEKGSKFQRLTRLFELSNQAVKELRSSEEIQLVHSQHCPNKDSDVVTFHNHSTRRLNEVGLWWEASLNDAKRRFVDAYKMRDEHDEALLRRASCLIFPAEVMKEDFYSAFPFLLGPPPKPYVVAHPGASMQEEIESDGSVRDGSGSMESGPDGSLRKSGLGAPGSAGFQPAQNGSGPDKSGLGAPGSAGFQPAQTDTFNFLFVGRGFRKKGLDVLFRACNLLKAKSGRSFTLSIAGLSQKPADTLRLNLLGLTNIVKYLGFQKDMNAVYANASAIILPSRVEPFGMAPVQAMQHGLVPIVSQVCGVAEVLHDGSDALILRNHLDADELSNLMLKLMNDSQLLRNLSLQARENALKVSWTHTVEQTLKAYEIALSLKK